MNWLFALGNLDQIIFVWTPSKVEFQDGLCRGGGDKGGKNPILSKEVWKVFG
jgi:hypothetical protein